MKKSFYYLSALALGLTFSLASCGDDDDAPVDPNGGTGTEQPTPGTSSSDIDYTAANAASWHNYMVNVAKLLKNDATELYEAWNSSYDGGVAYASSFKNHTHPYTSALNCVQELIEGCATIANEVGVAKIGDPYSLYVQGKTTEALYAVESWYSWHSIDDYSNNILSIRNSYYNSLDGSVAANSLSALINSVNPELNTTVIGAINTAYNAIKSIKAPFRNNINCAEAVEAMDACADLEYVLTNTLWPYIENSSNINSDEVLDPIVDAYVDNVVLPTYKSLMEKNAALYNAVVAIQNNPSNGAFEAACEAWLTAREPWEKSEAFLFGPVDALGLDPNMDSWPLDQDAIVQILNSGDFDQLEWTDENEAEAAQNVRGFHTLEFLLFKDGKARTVSE